MAGLGDSNGERSFFCESVSVPVSFPIWEI